MVRPTAGVARGDDPERDADDDHQDERGDHELDRRGEEGGDRLEDGDAVDVGPPVSGEESGEVAEVLLPQGEVEPEVVFAVLDRCLAVPAPRERVARVEAGREVKDEEGDCQDAEEDRDELEEPFEDEDGQVARASPRTLPQGPPVAVRPLRGHGAVKPLVY